jgi:hypothetical protein
MRELLDIQGAHAKNSKAIDEANAREIDNILTYLALCDRKTADLPSAREFDGAYLYGRYAGHDVQPRDKAEMRRLAAVLPRWHGRFIMPVHEPDAEYEVSNAKEFGEQESRVLIAQEANDWFYAGSTAVEFNIYALTRAGALEDRGGLYAYRKGGRLLIPPDTTKFECEALGIVFANTALHVYAVNTRWSIKARFGQGTPAMGFFTDPTGIKEFLKFRDKDDGKNRRDAVTHWVAQHWRQSRHDPDVEVYIREHLRGKDVHRWHGMEVKIIIPEIDTARVEEAKAHRKRLSASQLTKRVKQLRKIQG